MKDKANNQEQFQGIGNSPYHIHNGNDAPLIPVNLLKNIYFGIVNSDGSKGPIFPTGWSIGNISGGAYNIAHNLNTTNYLVVVSAYNGGGEVYASLRGYTSTLFNVHTVVAGVPSNSQFFFILIKK